MAKRKAKRKTKTIVSKLISIALIIAAIAIFTSVLQNVIKMFTLQQQAKLVEAELEALKDENASLISTKEKLEDPDYVQTYARGEYMFSKGDEKVFYLPGN
ncbi:MAG: septum formation initiator family protein [Erysipelotrichaceae bacterium]|nr:septum formation initiator family protein [Erysipelotrichaceae bacterium]MBO7697831.1 septum formation initiator family protein [Erysipelotrichaceae bacterium]MBP5279411.1 septum formation initiator family protein [Erysipelotrichaceae bacterium]